MLAHAPIGIAFFDTHARFIRMNEFLAAMNGVSIGNHIGRGVAEIFPGATGRLIEEGIHTVFATSEPVRDLEVNLGEPEEDGQRRPGWSTSIRSAARRMGSAGWALSLSIPLASSVPKTRCAAPRSSPPWAGSPPRSPMRSTTRSKRLPICCICFGRWMG